MQISNLSVDQAVGGGRGLCRHTGDFSLFLDGFIYFTVKFVLRPVSTIKALISVKNVS